MRRVRSPLATALFLVLALAEDPPARAHGERNQEPFLRMRTVHWYDVTWSADKVKVNDEIEVRGKLHIFSDWPRHLFELRTVYLNLGANGPVFVKVATYLNEVPMMQSTHLEYGKDYEFRIVAKARTPGRHHVHPMLNVESAGPLLGPGKWIDVSGDSGEVKVGGLAPLVTISNPEATDHLELNELQENDTVNTGGLAAGAIQVFVDGALIF